MRRQGEERLLINDRVRYGLRKGELKGSIKWLLKRKGIDVDSPFSAEGRGTLRKLRLREIDMWLDELALVESIIERCLLDVLRNWDFSSWSVFLLS